jgi:hypothetical protein
VILNHRLRRALDESGQELLERPRYGMHLPLLIDVHHRRRSLGTDLRSALPGPDVESIPHSPPSPRKALIPMRSGAHAVGEVGGLQLRRRTPPFRTHRSR